MDLNLISLDRVGKWLSNGTDYTFIGVHGSEWDHFPFFFENFSESDYVMLAIIVLLKIINNI